VKARLRVLWNSYASLKKRDWELWAIVSITGVLVSAALLAILFHAAFLKSSAIQFELTVSRPLAIGLFVLIALLNSYLVAKRFEVRRLREQLISSTSQNQVIEHQVMTDPLTDIYNRRSLDRIADSFISQARRQGSALCFVMVDANSFKQINTRFGHLIGDFVLSEIAWLLKSSVRASDAVVRYGGDEFLILLADTNVTGAENVIERMRGKLDDWNAAGNLKDFYVTLSIGAVEGQKGDTLDETLDGADRKMFEDKRS
jgi:diguanylate cyclase (GGDEF)-like protein